MRRFKTSPVRGQLDPLDGTERTGWRFLQCTETPDEFKVLLPPRTALIYQHLLKAETRELAQQSQISWRNIIYIRHLKDRLIRKCKKLYGWRPSPRPDLVSFLSVHAPPDFRMRELEQWYKEHGTESGSSSFSSRTSGSLQTASSHGRDRETLSDITSQTNTSADTIPEHPPSGRRSSRHRSSRSRSRQQTSRTEYVPDAADLAKRKSRSRRSCVEMAPDGFHEFSSQTVPRQPDKTTFPHEETATDRQLRRSQHESSRHHTSARRRDSAVVSSEAIFPQFESVAPTSVIYRDTHLVSDVLGADSHITVENYPGEDADVQSFSHHPAEEPISNSLLPPNYQQERDDNSVQSISYHHTPSFYVEETELYADQKHPPFPIPEIHYPTLGSIANTEQVTQKMSSPVPNPHNSADNSADMVPQSLSPPPLPIHAHDPLHVPSGSETLLFSPDSACYSPPLHGVYYTDDLTLSPGSVFSSPAPLPISISMSGVKPLPRIPRSRGSSISEPVIPDPVLLIDAALSRNQVMLPRSRPPLYSDHSASSNPDSLEPSPEPNLAPHRLSRPSRGILKTPSQLGYRKSVTFAATLERDSVDFELGEV